MINNQFERNNSYLDEIAKLPNGWDGPGNIAPNKAIISKCRQFITDLDRFEISQPSIHPIGMGILQIEWHKNGWDLEIEILSETKISVILATSDDTPIDNKEWFSNVIPLLKIVEAKL